MLPPTAIPLEQPARFADVRSFLADRPRALLDLVPGADSIPMLRTVLP